MISNKMKEQKDVSVFLKVYKNAYQIVLPITVLIAVFSGLLSIFPSKDGGDAQKTAIILFALFGILSIAQFTVEKILENTNQAYFKYTADVTSRVDLGKIIPLILFVLVVFIPFYILAVTSIKKPIEANQIDFTWLPSQGIDFGAYSQVFLVGDIIGITMMQAFLNSITYAIIPTVVGIFISALSAYGFAKLDFVGKKFVYSFLIFTIMLPGCVTMSSSFVLFDNIGWVDTPLPLIIPGCFGSVTCVVFLKEYFMGIPNELLEAANMDGAGKIGRFFYVILPVGVPALIAQFILIFISRYNEFTAPLIYLSMPEKFTIQIALNFFSSGTKDKNIISAASMIAVLPMLFIYVIFQKKILSGISMSSGLKG